MTVAVTNHINRRAFLAACCCVTCQVTVGNACGRCEAAHLQNVRIHRVGENVHVHSSNRAGFYVNSYLIYGESTATLIDAQLTELEAKKVIRKIKTDGKTLNNIVITHSHPDHYEGLQWIGRAFPKATIHSAAKSIEVISNTTRYWNGFENKLEPISSGKHIFSGTQTEILNMPDAESIAPLVLYLPQDRTLVTGDHVLADQHLWLAEQRDQQWLDNLDTLEKRWPIEMILPGHGNPGSLELFTHTRNYIRDFQNTVRTETNKAKAIERMREFYPQHRFPLALETSMVAYLGSG
ncbi:MAG: MBL fold metallo-hydrolase [Pseudomonadota bacterium]